MNNITELILLIDRSGSMHDLTQDVIGGYNALIESQKEVGPTKVTTIFFNDKATFIHEDVDIQEVKPIDRRSYIPSGCTALLDAIGDAISFIKARHAKLSEDNLPSHTIFSIMTDGLENASKEYSYPQIKSMIELGKKCGWDFLFQGANIDVIQESRKLGIHLDRAMSFQPSGEGIRYCMAATSAAITKSRKSK